MSFVVGFTKLALTEHQTAGLLALTSGGESAMYTAMKSKEKDKRKAYLKHRLETLKGMAGGGAVGAAGGAVLGHAAHKLLKAPSHVTLPLKGGKVPTALAGAMLLSTPTSLIGKYYGAKKGYEKVTGKRERSR